MDHFPIFNNHLRLLVDDLEITDYVIYDNKGYNDFPQRVGFDEEEVTNGLFLGQASSLRHQPTEYASLIQAWFYWALIHECTQEPVDVRDFTRTNTVGKTILTTRHLESKLVSWANRLQNMSRGVAQQHIRNAKDVLGRTTFLLTVLSKHVQQPEKIKGDDDAKQYWEKNGIEIFPRDLELAICALGFALNHAINAISNELNLTSNNENNPQAAGYWYTPPMLTDLLKLYRFCESDMIHFNDSIYGFVTSCMAVGLHDLSRRGDHSKCTALRCEADNIKPETYTRTHVQESCKCPEFLCQQAWQQMLTIIEQDGIPVVRVKVLPADAEDQEDLQIEVLTASWDVEYVAFSHVWADGRGNQTGNSMFRCQWQWLQECAQLCAQSKTPGPTAIEESFAFWIDTFCVPRGEGQRILDLRRKSITMMPEIYRSAKHVVVLDSALENLGHVSVLEFALRLKFCTWSRRVWTLHEGAVAKDVRIRTTNGLVSIVTLINQMARAKYPIRDESGWHILQSIELDYIHALLPTTVMFHQFKQPDESLFQFSWTELSKRTTSIENDRYLVLGIMNRLPPQTLLTLQRQTLDRIDPKAAAKQKLKIFLLAVKILPQSIIFTLDPRCDESGMHWAPGAIGAEIPQEQETTLLDTITDEGAVVKYNGWRLLSSLHDVKQSTFIRAETQSAEGELGRVFHVAVWPTDATRKSISSVCDLVLPGTALAIILEQVPEQGSTYTEFRRALLVEDCGLTLVEKAGSNLKQSAILAKYIAVLRVMGVSSERKADETIVASWVTDGDEQLWCVG